MHIADRLSRLRSDVVFAIAGQDRVCYGNDLQHTGGRTFKEYVLTLGRYDLSRFHFLGLLPPPELAKLFRLSDAHFYLTAPFILSWSLLDALACGCTVLASDTAPVCEIVRHEHNGLLANFYDEEGFVTLANKVLDDPPRFRALGRAGRELVEQRYGFEVCLPPLTAFFEETAAAGGVPATSSQLRGHGAAD
jgi:glycosyltransferase involved in cell wall biosynthesis